MVISVLFKTTSTVFFLSLISSPPNVSPPASPPRSVVLDCHHVSTIDYSVISELRDLLRQFKLREVHLVFSRLQVQHIGLRNDTFVHLKFQNKYKFLCGAKLHF